MKLEVITKNEEQTKMLAKKIATSIEKPAIVSLVGDLGAGKTTFTKGFAKGLGIEKMVTSPTFTILNEYTESKINMYHFDMYRLESEEEARTVGFETYFDLDSLDGVTVVEWAENTPGILPQKYYQVTLDIIDDDSRKVTIESIGM